MLRQAMVGLVVMACLLVASVGTPSASHSSSSRAAAAPSGSSSKVIFSPRSMTWKRLARSWKPSGLRAVMRRNRLILEGEKSVWAEEAAAAAAAAGAAAAATTVGDRNATEENRGPFLRAANRAWGRGHRGRPAAVSCSDGAETIIVFGWRTKP